MSAREFLYSKTESHPSRVRGLKFAWCAFVVELDGVAPLAGAWIEISERSPVYWITAVAPLAGAWIEIVSGNLKVIIYKSRTPRGCVD